MRFHEPGLRQSTFRYRYDDSGLGACSRWTPHWLQKVWAALDDPTK
jgi:hypothetical protein